MTDLPPTRSSVNDPGIDWDIAARTEVRLNGAAQNRVIEYDCEAGFLVRIVVDEKDDLVLNETGDEVATEIVHGAVTVAWKGQE